MVERCAKRRLVTLRLRSEKLAELEAFQAFTAYSTMAEAAHADSGVRAASVDSVFDSPVRPEVDKARSPSANKRLREGTIVVDEPRPKRMAPYPLYPEDYVEDEAKRQSTKKQQLRILAIPGAIETEVERTKAQLLALYREGALSFSWYDRLAILWNGDIGYHNGEPMQAQNPTSSSSVQARGSDSGHGQGLTQHQWKDICIALDRLPPTWPVVWTKTANKLRSSHQLGDKISLKKFQSKMRSAKEKHLQDLEKYLALIQPWDQGANHTPPDWEDFQNLSKDLVKWLPTLFGIRCYVAESNPNSVARTWHAHLGRKDRGIKEDMCRLQGGPEAAAALERLMCGNDKTVPSKDRRTAMHVIDDLRGLLHYHEKYGTILINVEEVFGDSRVPLGGMSFPGTEMRIRRLYDAVKVDMLC